MFTNKASMKNHFHGHLCMNTPDYIRLFRRYQIIGQIKQTSKWFVKGEKDEKPEELYLRNVQNYDIVMRGKWKKDRETDMKQLRRLTGDEIAAQIEEEKSRMARFRARYPSVQISFDITEPKLKFKTHTDSNYVFLLYVMRDYAADSGLFKEPNGCHICIEIAQPSNANTTSQINEGYLRLGVDRYYLLLHLLPAEFLVSMEQNANYFVGT